MEPRLTLLFDQSSLDELWDELDTLQALMDQAIAHGEGISDSISAQITDVNDSADQVKDATSQLSHALTDWADGDIEVVNDVSARISWTMDRLEPIADSVDAALDRIQESAGLAEEAMDELAQAGGLSEAALQDLRRALDRVDSSAQMGSVAVDQIRDALEQMKAAMGDSGAMGEALGEVKEAVGHLTDAFGLMSDAFDELWEAVKELHEQEGDSEQEDIDAPAEEEETTASDIEWPDYAPDGSIWGRDDVDWEAVLDALGEMRDASAQVKLALETLGNALAGVGSTAGDIMLDTLKDIAAAAEQVKGGFHGMDQAAGHIKDAFEHLDGIAPHGENASDLLKEAAQTLEEACGQLQQAGDTFHDVMSELADRPEISFRPVGDAVNDKSDALDTALGGLSNAMQGLNETISASSELLLEDMRAINRQFGTVIDVLRKHTDDSEKEEEEDQELLEDVSDQATETDEDAGRITNAKNTGAVEGDVNVAGIVGSMAIEYDYDPEDDLTTSGSRSLDFHYQAAALTERCTNSGQITGKKDYVGGIVGRMDLGTVSQCESYALVESTGGDYVGGIAGAAWSTIRDCWARCALAGNDYIGGVAGLGKTVNACRSLVEIDRGSAYLGAILGCLEENGEASENLFTHDTLNGINGISYLGKAEPVEFEVLSQGAPDAFTKFRLVFMAEDKEIATFDFSYGDALTQLPEIPDKEGCSASWPDMDYSCLTFSRTLEAEYTAYTTALTALGDPPQIVAEGTFSSNSAISASHVEDTWSDSHGGLHEGAVYTVTIHDPGRSTAEFQVQYKLQSGCKSCTVWVETGDGWKQQEAEIDGSYVIFPAAGSSVTFAVQESSTDNILVMAAAAGCAVGAGVVVLLFRKKRRRRRKHARK